MNWGVGDAEKKVGDGKFETQVDKVWVAPVTKCCFGMHKALGHKMLGIQLWGLFSF